MSINMRKMTYVICVINITYSIQNREIISSEDTHHCLLLVLSHCLFHTEKFTNTVIMRMSHIKLIIFVDFMKSEKLVKYVELRFINFY